MSHLPLWTPLASVLLALAWLMPNAAPPWLAFHKDAWLALNLLLVAGVVVFKRRSSIKAYSVDALSALFALLAIFTVVQWGLGIVYFSGHAAVGVAYFGAAALAVVLGRAWEQGEPGKPGDYLFLAFLLAALGTSGLMLVQWLQLDVNEVWVNYLPPSGRPFGNLIQPNNAATLLLLGIVSLLWFGIRGSLRRRVGLLGAAYLLFFIALTGFRVGYLSFVSLTLLGLFMSWRYTELRSLRSVSCVLLSMLPAFVLFISHDWNPSSLGGMASSQQPFDRDLTSARTQVYRAYLAAAWANPWTGYGFEQGAKTQMAAEALGHHVPGLFTWAHNAFLDLATWFGVPAALLALGAVVASLRTVVRGPFEKKRAVYFAGIYVVFLHGMVELPLAFAYFLLPICIFAGAMLAGLQGAAVALPKGLVAVTIVGLFTLLGAIAYDYLRVEAAFYTWRFKQANIGRNHPMDIPDTVLLNQYEALLRGLRGSPGTLTDEAMQDFEQAIFLDPSAAGMQHLAELQLGRGDVAGAQKTADMGRLLTKDEQRKALAARWRYLAIRNPAYREVDWRD